MRKGATATLCVAIGLMTGAGCARCPMPASPVAAPLSEMEAMRTGERYVQSKRGLGSAELVGIQRESRGYLLIYHTAYNPYATPAKESHLLAVNNDGTVRELVFEKGR